MEELIWIFSEVEDPRAANARHSLLEVIVIALAAVLCGATNCAEMAEFGRAKQGLLRQMLALRHGVPSHDTFSRVFRLLDPEQFEAAFRRFMTSFAASSGLKGVVAIDGKAVRGAYQKGARSSPLHLVNVWAVNQRLALAQRTAPGRNEIAGTLEVLKLLSLRGCTVTADALHCHPAMAQAVLDSGANYVLAVKGNHGPLYAALGDLIWAGAKVSQASTEETSHGRFECRSASVMSNTTFAAAHHFPGIRAVGRIVSLRRIKGKPDETDVRYFVLSRQVSAAKLLEVVRSHWSIENQLHWVLDVVFDEDGARNRVGHGPENLSLIRKIALNLLQSDAKRGSLKRSIKRAGWDDNLLLSLLGQMR